MKHPELIANLTLEEKAAFCDGKDFWHLQDLPRLDIPSIMVTDGPHGLRREPDEKTGHKLLSSVPATCFPTAATTACSWDPSLLEEMGRAIGEEALQEGVSVVLGPGVNMKRSPLCGRNFEYFSEDPILAGEMAAAVVNGLQSVGVGASVKHFAGNNQETRRLAIDTVADERALREIYLPAFEIAVKKAKPWTIMNSYNRLNGVYTAENQWLLQKVLRRDWGFDGLVVTDWGAENDRAQGIRAGGDLEMPTSSGLGAKAIIRAIENGDLKIEELNECVDRVLDLILRSDANRRNFLYDKKAHHALAQKIAEHSMVLLKNDDQILPLKKGQTIAVIGEMARSPRYQGAGSSGIQPTELDNAFDQLLAAGVSVRYAPGYSKKSDVPDARLIGEAVQAAEKADVAVVFAGLTEVYESEGYDRVHMQMPADHNALIEAVARVNPNTVVVLSGGSPVEMPWLPHVRGLLNAYLGGQASGAAVASLLTGRVNPSGKLAETYPLTLADNPSYENFPGGRKTVEYRESIYIGYRYYDTAKQPVLFPFGYGLSYTEFTYSGLRLSAKKIKDSDKLTLSFTVKNTGTCDGEEICQIYVRDNESTIFRPEKELKAFRKLFLKAGESQKVKVELSKRDFAFYNINGGWQVESGEFTILVGASSRDIRLKATLTVESDCQTPIPDYRESAPEYYTADVHHISDSSFEAVLGRPIPPSEPAPDESLTMLSTLEDAMQTPRGEFVGKLLDTVMNRIGSGDDDPAARMAKAMALQIPIRSLVAMSMGVFTPEMAQALLDILNGGSLPKGIFKLLQGLALSLKNIQNLLSAV